jgi:hypothetical protein
VSFCVRGFGRVRQDDRPAGGLVYLAGPSPLPCPAVTHSATHYGVDQLADLS